MSVDLKWNKGNKRVTVTLVFDSDPQVDKPGLEKSVITNHLLTQAAYLCSEAAALALNGSTDESLNAEAAAKKAEIDAEVAKRKTNKLTSDV